MSDLKKLVVELINWGIDFKMVEAEGYETLTFYDSDDADAVIKELQTERDRYREALERIRDIHVDIHGRMCSQIVRKALEQTDGRI